MALLEANKKSDVDTVSVRNLELEADNERLKKHLKDLLAWQTKMEFNQRQYEEMTGKQIELLEPQLREIVTEIQQIEVQLELQNEKVKE